MAPEDMDTAAPGRLVIQGGYYRPVIVIILDERIEHSLPWKPLYPLEYRKGGGE